MTYFLEQLINGICQGSIYAMVAIGFTMIAGIIGVVSFCYGETVMLGAYIAYLIFSTMGATYWAFLVTFIGMAIFAIIVHKVCYEPFFNSPRHISLMCTIGMGTIVKNLVNVFTNGQTLPVPRLFEGSIMVGPVTVSMVKVASLTIVVLLCAFLSFLLNRTRVGVQLRAISQNRKAASLLGINVSNMTMLGNILACGFGGISGILFTLYYNSFYAYMGDKLSMKAFASSVLGGLTDIPVSAGGGYIISIAENFGIPVLPSGFRDVIAFVFLILVLIVMPGGLSATMRRISAYRERRKADAAAAAAK